MKDLTLDRSLRQDDKGPRVRLVQKWLSLHGFGVVPDRNFGPATDSATRDFQSKKGLSVDGVVGGKTFEARLTDAIRTRGDSAEKDVGGDSRGVRETAPQGPSQRSWRTEHGAVGQAVHGR